MTQATASKTDYFLVGHSPFGESLWTSRDYIRIEGGVGVSTVGSMVFYLPAAGYDRTDFPIDGVVELWRAPIGLSPKLFLDRVWHIRGVYKDIKGSQRVWRVVCYDSNYILGDPGGQVGRVIAYNPNNDFTHKLLPADDMCKEIINENLGSDATDTDRIISSFFTVQEEFSLAPTIRKELSRRLVLSALQEICQASLKSGTYLAFDIVCPTPPSASATGAGYVLQFQTFVNQRGEDHRSNGESGALLIGPDVGNMDDVTDGIDHTGEITYVYAVGQSVGDVSAVLPAFDSQRIGISPLNRREYVVNASDTFDLEALQNEADAALKAGRPKRIITGKYIDSDQARFGVDWDYGDYLTAQVEGEVIDCRNEAIGFRINAERAEDFEIALRGDDVE